MSCNRISRTNYRNLNSISLSECFLGDFSFYRRSTVSMVCASMIQLSCYVASNGNNRAFSMFTRDRNTYIWMCFVKGKVKILS